MRGAALIAGVIVALAAGCGGAPHAPARSSLPRALAARWATEADRIATELQAHDDCAAQQLAQTLVADVDAGSNRVPARFRTALLTASTRLAARISCVPIPPEPKGPPPKKHGPGPDHKHGHGKEGDGG